jgi:hypothetical protein
MGRYFRSDDGRMHRVRSLTNVVVVVLVRICDSPSWRSVDLLYRTSSRTRTLTLTSTSTTPTTTMVATTRSDEGCDMPVRRRCDGWRDAFYYYTPATVVRYDRVVIVHDLSNYCKRGSRQNRSSVCCFYSWRCVVFESNAKQQTGLARCFFDTTSCHRI